MEGLGLARVVALVPSFRCRTVQVPEDTPPRVQESRGFAQCDVLLPPDLGQEGLCCLLCPYVQQVLVHVQRQLLSRLCITGHRRVLGLSVHPGCVLAQDCVNGPAKKNAYFCCCCEKRELNTLLNFSLPMVALLYNGHQYYCTKTTKWSACYCAGVIGPAVRASGNAPFQKRFSNCYQSIFHGLLGILEAFS